MNKYLIGAGVIVLCLGVGYGIGRYAQPAKVETKIEIVTVEKEKIVEKIVYKDTVKMQKHTIILEFPDGRKETNIYELYESTVMIDSQKTIDLEKKVKELESKIITNVKPQWQAYAIYEFPDVYGAQVNRRIIGPFFMGVQGNTDKKFGATLGMEF
jgi:hypothetical protein